uniref:Uncharacterized protein n=1 Tax=Fagus sylvatica TaxID=28930 RepID=A0A2N9GPV6_FAGSY
MGGQMQQSNAAAAALYDGGGPLHNAVPAGGGGSDAGGDAVMARWLQSAGLQHLASPLASTGIDHRLLPNLLMQVVVLGGSGFVGLATSKAAVSKGIEGTWKIGVQLQIWTLYCDLAIGRNYNLMGANIGGQSSSCSEAIIECLKSICST